MKVCKEGQCFEGSLRDCAKFLGVNPSSLSRAGQRQRLSRKLRGVAIEFSEADTLAGDKAREAAYRRKDLLPVQDPLFGTVYKKKPSEPNLADSEIKVTFPQHEMT